jgi:predicted transcriptional regulator
MATRTKRTYNLSDATVRRVREIAERYGSFRTQDQVVDAAVERLYIEISANVEADEWAAAAADPEFIAESREIADAFGDRDTWPA